MLRLATNCGIITPYVQVPDSKLLETELTLCKFFSHTASASTLGLMPNYIAMRWIAFWNLKFEIDNNFDIWRFQEAAQWIFVSGWWIVLGNYHSNFFKNIHLKTQFV